MRRVYAYPLIVQSSSIIKRKQIGITRDVWCNTMDDVRLCVYVHRRLHMGVGVCTQTASRRYHESPAKKINAVQPIETIIALINCSEVHFLLVQED